MKCTLLKTQGIVYLFRQIVICQRVTGNQQMRNLWGIIALFFVSSCTIVRGYLADGAYGPTSFSYEKQLKDTIVNRGEAFSFGKASTPCDWIDTLHFFNQGRMYSNTTMWEAIGP